jgi:hypothetical protein
MKKFYSTPVVTSSDVVRDTLSALVNPHFVEPNNMTSLIKSMGFGL